MHRILKMGNPILNQKAPEMDETEFRSDETKKIIRKLVETCEQKKLAALAANQLGYLARVMVAGSQRRTLINPTLKNLSDEKETDWEGCASIPLIRGLVPRFVEIECKAYDFHLAKEVTFKAYGFEARLLQHAYDHLNGILYPQRIDQK